MKVSTRVDPISAAFDKFHDDADVKKTLEKYFVVVPVHVQNNEGGGELYTKYGGGENEKTFILHYSFPPFSVGETGRTGGASLREIVVR